MLLARPLVRVIEEVLLGLGAALANGVGDITGKFWLQYYVIVQIFLQVLSAFTSSVSVKHPEYLQLWPFISWYFRLFS